MRSAWLVSLFAACMTVGAQGPAPAKDNIDSSLEHARLFNDVPGFTAPILRPLTITPNPENRCDGERQKGEVQFSFIVDGAGRPRNIIFERALGNDVDFAALRVMEVDSFKPAELIGAAVAAIGALEMRLEVCVEVRNDQSGQKSATLRLLGQPNQVYDERFRSKDVVADGQHVVALATDADSTQAPILIEGKVAGVTPPKVIHAVEAQFTDYARTNHLQGAGLFRLVVDEHGLPHDIAFDPSVTPKGPLDPSLVQQAILAIRQYRFKPAVKDGLPIPARVSIEVDFVLGD